MSDNVKGWLAVAALAGGLYWFNQQTPPKDCCPVPAPKIVPAPVVPTPTPPRPR